MSNKNPYILKQVQFRTESKLDMALLKSIEALKINFNEETKLFWLSKIKGLNIDDVRNERRLGVLRERLETDLSREQKWKIKNEIKQIEESMNEH